MACGLCAFLLYSLFYDSAGRQTGCLRVSNPFALRRHAILVRPLYIMHCTAYRCKQNKTDEVGMRYFTIRGRNVCCKFSYLRCLVKPPDRL